MNVSFIIKENLAYPFTFVKTKKRIIIYHHNISQDKIYFDILLAFLSISLTNKNILKLVRKGEYEELSNFLIPRAKNKFLKYIKQYLKNENYRKKLLEKQIADET